MKFPQLKTWFKLNSYDEIEDFNQTIDDKNILMFCLQNNKELRLNLTFEQVNFLFENSDLTFVDSGKNNALNYFLTDYDSIKRSIPNLNFDKKYFFKLVKRIDLNQTSLYGYNLFMKMIDNINYKFTFKELNNIYEKTTFTQEQIELINDLDEYQEFLEQRNIYLIKNEKQKLEKKIISKKSNNNNFKI